jgi:hypothetical protein
MRLRQAALRMTISFSNDQLSSGYRVSKLETCSRRGHDCLPTQTADPSTPLRSGRDENRRQRQHEQTADSSAALRNDKQKGKCEDKQKGKCNDKHKGKCDDKQKGKCEDKQKASAMTNKKASAMTNKKASAMTIKSKCKGKEKGRCRSENNCNSNGKSRFLHAASLRSE